MIKKINEKFPHTGDILIRVWNKKLKKFTFKKILNNQITNSARDELIKPLYGATPDMNVAFLAVGTGTTSPAATDNALVLETFRVADTDLNRTDVGQVTSEFVLDGLDYIAEVAAGTISEIGFFAGSGAAAWGAGAGKDTGLLISRVLFSYTITVDEEIYFQRVDSITV